MGHRKGNLRHAQDPERHVLAYTLHTANKVLAVLLLRVPVCRASVGRRFHEDKARRSSYNKTWIRPYMRVMSHDAWAHGLFLMRSLAHFNIIA